MLQDQNDWCHGVMIDRIEARYLELLPGVIRLNRETSSSFPLPGFCSPPEVSV